MVCSCESIGEWCALLKIISKDLMHICYEDRTVDIWSITVARAIECAAVNAIMFATLRLNCDVDDSERNHIENPRKTPCNLKAQ